MERPRYPALLLLRVSVVLGWWLAFGGSSQFSTCYSSGQGGEPLGGVYWHDWV